MKKRFLVILAAFLAGYWAYLQVQERRAARLFGLGSRPEETPVTVEATGTDAGSRGSFYTHGLTAGVITALVLAMIVLLPILLDAGTARNREHTPVAVEITVEARVCRSGFPACPYSDIVAAIKTAEASGENSPCTYAVENDTEIPNNLQDNACHTWLFGTTR